MADEQPVVAVVRGDQELNEAKLQTATGAQVIRPARPEEIPPLMGARAGSLGAVGFTRATVLVDPSLADRRDMVTGANEDGFHLRGVDVRRDVLGHGKLAELRTVRAGEGCPRCDGTLDVFKALEVGHIFKLGTKYSESMKATVLDADGKQVPIVMGSYGIGVERIMAAAIELHADQNGIVWPFSIAPFDVTVLTLGPEPELKQAADEIVAAARRGRNRGPVRRPRRAGRREVQGRRPHRHPAADRGGEEGAGRGPGGVEAPARRRGGAGAGRRGGAPGGRGGARRAVNGRS